MSVKRIHVCTSDDDPSFHFGDPNYPVQLWIKSLLNFIATYSFIPGPPFPTGSFTINGTIPRNVKVGSPILVFVFSENVPTAPTHSVEDSQGNTYTQIGPYSYGTFPFGFPIVYTVTEAVSAWITTASTTGSLTITATTTNTPIGGPIFEDENLGFVAIELPGISTVDGHHENQVDNNAPLGDLTTGDVPITVGSDLLIGAFLSRQDFRATTTDDPGFTRVVLMSALSDFAPGIIYVAYKQPSGVGAQAITATQTPFLFDDSYTYAAIGISLKKQ